jgi:hypothetical protein
MKARTLTQNPRRQGLRCVDALVSRYAPYGLHSQFINGERLAMSAILSFSFCFSVCKSRNSSNASIYVGFTVSIFKLATLPLMRMALSQSEVFFPRAVPRFQQSGACRGGVPFQHFYASRLFHLHYSPRVF